MNNLNPIPTSTPDLRTDLLTQFYPRVCRLADSRFGNTPLHDEALDKLTDALYRAVAQYDSTRGDFSPWLNSLLHTACRKILCKPKPSSSTQQLTQPVESSIPSKPTHTHSSRDSFTLDPDSLSLLTPKQKSIIADRFTLSQNFRELGRTRKISKQAAHKHYQRGLHRLRKAERMLGKPQTLSLFPDA